MIRIDEIYEGVFWPWIQENLPGSRMFFCDPPGRSDPESLMLHGRLSYDSNYILFHDQEPIHLSMHTKLFDAAEQRSHDMNHGSGPKKRAVITSELDNPELSAECDRRSWQHYYYFFHGWAALDWFRGYDRSFHIHLPEHRRIDHSFVNPNRIIGGLRRHRVELMYHLLKKEISRSYTSFPSVCPAEFTSIEDLARSLPWADAEQIFSRAGLPWNMPGEIDHPMHSCRLDLWQQCSRSLAYVVTETVAAGQRQHLTEKIFKPICLQMPFVLLGAANNLKYLRSYGFQTFGHVWDESYDLEIDDGLRIAKVADLLSWIDSRSTAELQELYQACVPVIRHNFQHFYRGNFEALLWSELTQMLHQIKRDFDA